MLKKIFVILCMLLVLHGTKMPNKTIANYNADSDGAFKDVKVLQEKGILNKALFYNMNGNVYLNDAASLFERLLYTTNNYPQIKWEFTGIIEHLPQYNLLAKRITRDILYSNMMDGVYLTRAEAAKMIMKTFRINEDVTTAEILDVHFNEPYYIPIMTLSKLNIITYTDSRSYRPTEPITVAELSSMIVAALDFQTALESNEVIYNYLEKQYINTENTYWMFEQKIIEEINIYREKKGIRPLEYDPKLTQLALVKVKDMVDNNYFDHQSPTYNMPWDLAGVFNYEFVTFGENLARYYINAEDVVDAWIASPTHNENLLKSSYVYLGIGITTDEDGNFYFCNLFSGR